MTTSAVSAFFNALPSPWLLDFASYLGPQNIDPSVFCAADPPADPGMTALDFAQVLQIGNPFIQTPALFKLAQLFRRYLWYQICECSAGTQPTPPAAPSPPSGLTDVNPPALTPPIASTPCLVATAYNGTVSSGISIPGNNLTLPAGATSLLLRITTLGAAFSGTRNTNLTMTTNWSTGSGAAILNVQETFTITPSMNAPLEFTAHIPTNGAVVNYQTAVSGGSWAAFLHADHAVFCGGVTPTGTPCDQTVDLSSVLALLEYLRSQIDLIQRQAVPFAYQPSVVHSGLSGTGQITFSGLIGARIVIDDMGSNVGSVDGTPDDLWQAGEFRWGNADGWGKRNFINASPLTSLPAAAGQYTRLGYTLPPGVEITITELRREA